MLKFKINDYITLKLENDKTNIYVAGKKFIQCKSLIINIPFDEVESYSEIGSIDEISERLKRQHVLVYKISPEVEFWGHCSNLQAWVEHNYDTRLLHKKLAFPLLKKLVDAGDLHAKQALKEEIATKIETGYPNVVRYLIEKNYLYYLNSDELDTLINIIENSEIPDLVKKLKSIRENQINNENALVNIKLKIPDVNERINDLLKNVKDGFIYSENHYWINPNNFKVGITPFHYQFNDINSVNFNMIKNNHLKFYYCEEFDEFLGVPIEKVFKTKSNLFSSLSYPISGEVISINKLLNKQPDLIQNDPYEKGWIYQVVPDDFERDSNKLYTAEEYRLITYNVRLRDKFGKTPRMI
jgi:glycine cleavage system H protein